VTKTSLPEPLAQGSNLSFEQVFDVPKQVTALRGGKIITMRDADNQQEVIENGVILIEGNRISAIGTLDDINIPEDALVVDTSGKSIIPGLVLHHVFIQLVPFCMVPKHLTSKP